MNDPDKESRVASMLVDYLSQVEVDVEEAIKEGQDGGDPVEDVISEFMDDAEAVLAFLQGCRHAVHAESMKWIQEEILARFR